MSDYTSDLNAILDEDLTKVDNSVYHTEIQDEHDALTIDKNTREIIAGSTETLVVGDANSAIKTFVIDRYYDGVDLSEKSIKIVYRRADGEGDINDATDIQVGTNQITFSWVLNYHALFVSGAISFIVEFIGTDEFGDEYILKTKTCTLIPDGDTLSNTDAVSPAQDWVVEIENRISALEEGGTGSGSGGGTGSGSDGYSPIANVVETSTGATITITDKTGTTTARIKNGADGADGESVTVTTEETADGYDVTFTDVDGANTISIKNGSDGYTPVKGVDYNDGNDGNDGVSPTISTNKVDKVTTITITDVDGTKTVDINDGEDGKTPDLQIGTVSTLSAGSSATATITGTAENPVINLGIPKGADGDTGAQGTSVTHSWNGTTLTVTSASGTSSADLKGEKGNQGDPGTTPVKGVDYFTDSDKTELVDSVLASLTSAEEVAF